MSVAEVHGVTHAKRLAAGGWHGDVRVTVSIDNGLVCLRVTDLTYPAGMTADEARYLATKLHRLARQLDAGE